MSQKNIIIFQSTESNFEKPEKILLEQRIYKLVFGIMYRRLKESYIYTRGQNFKCGTTLH